MSAQQSKWDEHNLTEEIKAILSGVKPQNETPHFGNVFLSSYQLAIEYAKRHPDYLEILGKEIGGEGTGSYDSLAKYFAGKLSVKIKKDSNFPIEGGFLSCHRLE